MTPFVISFDVLPGFNFTNRSSQYRDVVFRMFFLNARTEKRGFLFFDSFCQCVPIIYYCIYIVGYEYHGHAYQDSIDDDVFYRMFVVEKHDCQSCENKSEYNTV